MQQVHRTGVFVRERIVKTYGHRDLGKSYYPILSIKVNWVTDRIHAAENNFEHSLREQVCMLPPLITVC